MTAKNKSIVVNLITGIVATLAAMAVWNMFLEDVLIKDTFDNTDYEIED